MAITVELPGALEPYARGQATLAFSDRCDNVASALALVGASYPGVRDRVVDEQGELRAHVNVFVNNENVRFLSGLQTPLGDNATIVILPSVSGG